MSGTRSTVDDAPRSSVKEEIAEEPHLFLVLECDRLAAGGARYSLAGAKRVVIGRGPDRSCQRTTRGGEREVLVQIPSKSMSSVHLRLTREGQVWTVEDLGSRNGTYLNGARVTASAVRDGDILEAGRTFFILRSRLSVTTASPADVDSQTFASTPPGLATLLPLEAHQLAIFSRVAESDVPLLLLGETGTGKELLARAAHELSGRKGRFVAVNCGAIAPSLVESLLFGHVKGSFSGATTDSLGFFRAADRGTLFLDEVGDLAPPAQAALLRSIEESEVVPVGAPHPLKVDVRVVAATHRPISHQDERGRFRSDLLARIAGYTHRLVPLRMRREDIGMLAANVLHGLGLGDKAERISPGAAQSLLKHDWPMNVRELRQTLKTAALLSTHGVLETTSLPATMFNGAEGVPAAKHVERILSKKRLSEEDEELRALLISHLTACQGNISAVARAMGKASTQIHRWLKRFDLNANQFRT
jgi:transcriptional regulator of acetoin/glycerol metabolism